MHDFSASIGRRNLVDPAACGVRLGIELRAAAEREANSAGMCLSHWIKQVVRNAVKASRTRKGANSDAEIQGKTGQQNDAVKSALDTAFTEEMEKLNT